MALPIPAPSVVLDELQHAALSNCVASILEDLATGATSATVVSAAMEAVLHAVQSSCVGFAANWNDMNTRAITTRLPVEVLTPCLAPADFETRLRASQVSRAWRTALISDRQLWTDIYCPITRQQDAVFELLEALLERSSPLPFRLRIPRSHCFNYRVYRNRIAARVAPHIHRLQSYDGPAIVFVALEPPRRALPTLTSFDCLNEADFDECVDQGPELSAQRLPNLRRLIAPMLILTDPQPYERLQHLVCCLRNGTDYADLFRCFPNLVTAEFVVDKRPMRLPPGPVPPSVERITIRAEDLRGAWPNDASADFACLEDWAAARIPRLVLRHAGLVSAIARAFALTHGSALRLDVGGEIKIFSAPDAQHVWEVHTRDSLWERSGCEAEMRALLVGTAAPSICVTNVLIRPFFAAHACLPHLVSLKFDLSNLPGDLLQVDPDSVSHYRVEAPNLHHVCLEIHGNEWTLLVLRRNFRRMIVYEAELLETLTVDYLGYEVTGDSDCAELARFAKQYIVVR